MFIMYRETTIVTDPLHNEIFIPKDLCVHNISEREEFLDDYQKVIEAPACIIEESLKRKFYFRSVGWNLTMLIETNFIEGKWIAVDCRLNPSTDYISTLLKNGKFIPGSSIN